MANRLLDWFNSVNPYAHQPDAIPVSVFSPSSARNDAERTRDLLGSPSEAQIHGIFAPETEGLGVLSLFAQTLLKKLPDCIDRWSHVKTAFSIAKATIQINQELGENKDELADCVEETARRLLAVERMIDIDLPWIVRQEMDTLTQVLEEEMSKLQDLALKPLQPLSQEEGIRNIFHRVNDAAMAFQFGVAYSIREKGSRTPDEVKKESLKCLRPSEKADHRNVPEQLRHEECTPGTRVKILQDIAEWANDSSLDSPRVFWLTGQPGSGKTTIAYTIARRFENGRNTNQHAVLGANFFCSRQFEETRERTRIVPTIACQLAHKCESYADALHFVTWKVDAVNRDVGTQLKHFLLIPWQQCQPTRCPQTPPYLIVIDGLDEIKDEGELVFLHALLGVIEEYDLRGLKFLLTSRSDPEVAEVYEFFASNATDCRLQELPIEEARPDVEIYLKERLKTLNGRPELDELVKRAGGLFIYASTVLRYLTLAKMVTVEEKIEVLNKFFSKSHEPTSSSDASLVIDNLYRQIMLDTFSNFEGRVLARRLHIVYTILCTAERASTSTVAALVHRRLVPGGDIETVDAVLGNLHAVLFTQGDRVFWYHTSFPDFIFTPARSNFRIGEKDFRFSCNEPFHHKFLSESCFLIMKSGLRFNMGNITSSFLFDSNNASALSKEVNRNISTSLRYACRYWAHHLVLAKVVNTGDLCDFISQFLQIRVLFWIEAMNLLGFRDQCAPMLQRARQWVLECGNRYLKLADDLDEATKFALHFTESPAAESTPHLYISALATWPQTSSLCRNWRRSFSHLPYFTGQQLPAGEGHTGKINSVMFSPDGTQIVSGSNDWSVRLWNATTAAQMRVFKGHTNIVTSVAFSADGTRIISGSHDYTVRMWDASTGAQLKMFYHHTCEVNSAAFSPDGTRIVSGDDSSVSMWDASTGVQMLRLPKGHTSKVNSVAFSPDARRIASASDDKSVRVWDALKGMQVHVLNGHALEVSSVAFSPDGTCIASGSHDCSVRVWDASTGEQLEVIKGHIDWVTSLVFSPDGAWIISGSRDQSIRIWDASKGIQVQIFRGHTHHVTSISFSNEGTLAHVVSSSVDKTIRVWTLPRPLVKFNQPYWTRSANNWIISPRGDRLLWVPKIGCLIKPFSTLHISNIPFVGVDFYQSKIGDNWVQCYTP